jgi:ankyrin repeat protein
MRRVARVSGVTISVLAIWFAACCGRFHSGRTLLMEVSRLGMWPLVQVLVFLGAKVNDQSIGRLNSGGTPLAYAATGGNLRTVTVLLDAGAEPNWGGWSNIPWPREKGPEPLPEEGRALCRAVASPSASADVVQLLLRRGAQVESQATAFTALGCWPRGKERAKKVSLLVEAGANPNGRFPRGDEPLLTVYAGAGFTDVVEVLLSAGADIHVRGSNGSTAWQEATRRNHSDTAALLLARGGAASNQK